MSQLLLKKIKLQSGEELQNIIRPSFWFKFWQILIVSVLILLPFFLIYPLFREGWPGILAFGLLLIAGIIVLLRIYITYYFTAFITTNFRVIDIEQKGFLNRLVSEIIYKQISDVNYKSKGLLNSILHHGDIYINIKGKQRTKIKLIGIKNPETIVSQILLNQKEALKSNKLENNSEYFLEKIRNKLGDKIFNQLISD